MSKNKARHSEPARSSSGRSTPRTVSATASGKASPSPKFYDGPTVKRSEKDATPPLKKASASTALVPVKKVKKRRGCSIFGLITFLPFLLFLSLFSTVLCPPPNTQQSSFSRYALNSLGLGKSKSTHSSLHETLCYPANVYHETVLQPYVYPVLADVQAQIQSHPVYKDKVEPGYNRVKGTALRVWNGPVKPVVNRIARGARKFYLSNIQPRLPFVKAKITEFTAPVTIRVKAQYDKHLAAHVKVAKKHACTAAKQIKATYRTIAGHPLTAQAGKHTQTAFRLGKEHTHKAYVFTKPHAIKAWHFSAHHSRHTVLPRVIYALEVAFDNIARALGMAKTHTHKLYQAHAAQHVDPYLNKAREAIAPYQVVFNDKVYEPHLKPLFASILPVIPEPPKSFWSYVADWVPAGGVHVEDRGQKIFNKEDIKVQQPEVEKPKKETVPDEKPKVQAEEEKPKVVKIKPEPEPEVVPEATKSVSPEDEPPIATFRVQTPEVKKVTEDATTASTVAEVKTPAPSTSATLDSTADHKADVVASLAEFKKKLDFQAKAGYGRIQSEMLKEGERFLQLLPEMASIGRENLDREMTRMVSGLDRLYTNSKSLTRGQVAESMEMSDKKVAAKFKQAQSGIQTRKNQLKDKVQPVVTSAQSELDKVLGAEYEALGKKMAIVDGITSKEWDAYKGLKKDAESWKTKYAELPEKPNTKPLKELSNSIQVKMGEIMTEFTDLYENFRVTQLNMKKLALERIAAREAIAKDEKQAPLRAGGAKKADSADSGRVSIQPIKEEGADNVRGGAPIIGKDKVQVEEALKKAQRVSNEEKAKITGRTEL